jgi:hypothetical protein
VTHLRKVGLRMVEGRRHHRRGLRMDPPMLLRTLQGEALQASAALPVA